LDDIALRAHAPVKQKAENCAFKEMNCKAAVVIVGLLCTAANSTKVKKEKRQERGDT